MDQYGQALNDSAFHFRLRPSFRSCQIFLSWLPTPLTIPPFYQLLDVGRELDAIHDFYNLPCLLIISSDDLDHKAPFLSDSGSLNNGMATT